MCDKTAVNKIAVNNLYFQSIHVHLNYITPLWTKLQRAIYIYCNGYIFPWLPCEWNSFWPCIIHVYELHYMLRSYDSWREQETWAIKSHSSEHSWQQRPMSSTRMLKTNCKQVIFSHWTPPPQTAAIEKWTGSTHTTDLPTQHIAQHRCSLRFSGPHEGMESICLYHWEETSNYHGYINTIYVG